jgi:hypothetical protein
MTYIKTWGVILIPQFRQLALRGTFFAGVAEQKNVTVGGSERARPQAANFPTPGVVTALQCSASGAWTMQEEIMMLPT